MEIGEAWLIEHFDEGGRIFVEFAITEEEAEKRVASCKERDKRIAARPSKFSYKITKIDRLA